MTDAELDREVRIAIARSIKTRGRIPTIAAVAADIGKDLAAVDASFARMIEGHVFIPAKDSHEIYAYDPFCVGPTDFFVTAAGRVWFGICAWDALGIPAALGEPGVVETHCGDCGESIIVEVDADGATDVPEDQIRLELDYLEGKLPGVRRRDAVWQMVGLADHDGVINKLVRHPRILDVVQSLLGPDIKYFSDQVLMKPARQSA